ncbi:Na+/H+ antiporter [Nonomuraea typhae]|uniref:Na+/H+ antiporter n=1 Tax=Nonomuraea typhae TaxID=2603600 RepID=UPI0012FBA0E7|nr:Na+/H+ antiporter [Nonomuraea typhae]
MQSVQIVLSLVAVATVVATFADRVSVPAPSLLVVAGILVGLLPVAGHIQVTPEIVSLVVLPPLLYAAGEELSWQELKNLWRPVALLAVGLVLVSAAAVGYVSTLLTPMPLPVGFVLGAVLASTDPVAVTALGRRLSLPPRLQTLVQAESLFNDATSLILFRIAVAAAVAGGVAGWSGVAADFLLLAGGGALVGTLMAAVISFVRRRTEDPVLESVIALLTPYVTFVLAENVHASGVTAVIVTGVILGVRAHRLTNSGIRLQLTAVYGTLIFILESVVFSLIGIQLPGQIEELAGQPWIPAALVIAVVLVAVRVAWMVPLSAVQQWRGGGRIRPAWQVPAVVSWAGARGVVPLAAALSIPATLPHRPLLMVLTTSVIVISLVVQGFTLAPLVRLSGLAVAPDNARAEYTLARAHLSEIALTYVDELADLEAASPVVLQHVRRSLEAQNELEQAPDELAEAYGHLRRDVLAVQTAEVARLHTSGKISEETRRRLQLHLDRQDQRYLS